MNILSKFLVVTVSGAALLGSGCATTNSETRVTNPNQPGPAVGHAVGHAVGTAVGAVGSNVVGAVVGGVEGAAAATKSTFTNEHRIIRTWRTETTADGRTIQVPVEIEVDANGRPIEKKP
ncbi:MAG: flagellar motor protein MotB [Cephaloticoccus sp.]|nr:flagellar motor protein MotB [Cephaloticoccus sp.]MCF7759474.1 flagellar motor protein MotB [Cephaloticoccus sp.]